MVKKEALDLNTRKIMCDMGLLFNGAVRDLRENKTLQP
jgi:hypothetical protein